MRFDKKIKDLGEIIKIRKLMKGKGKKVVLSIGIFDIIHPGIVRHFRSARKAGDVLIVGIIKNENVRKGPGMPVFDEKLRAENVASVEFVDYVCIIPTEKTYKLLEIIKPDVFARGEEYKEGSKIREEEILFKLGCRIHSTGILASSTEIINQFLDLFPEGTKKYLKNFSRKFSAESIFQKLEKLKGLKVLVIGDGIIDEYHYCQTMGKSAKDALVANRFQNKESFAGGTFAVANHIAGFCKEVKMLSVIGRGNSYREFILEKMKKNIGVKLFKRPDAPTIVKRRYIESYFNKKLFEIVFIEQKPIPESVEKKIIGHLNSCIKGFDVVIVPDFGHGIMTEKIIKLLEVKSNFLAVNTQINSANEGFNVITKYHNIDFACLKEFEARIACHDEYGSLEKVIKKIAQKIKAKNIAVTLGSNGAMIFSRRGGFNSAPAVTTRVVDRIGAGDAFFSIASLCAACGFSPDLLLFLGNVAGAITVQTVCNREPVTKEKLLEYVNILL